MKRKYAVFITVLTSAAVVEKRRYEVSATSRENAIHIICDCWGFMLDPYERLIKQPWATEIEDNPRIIQTYNEKGVH